MAELFNREFSLNLGGTLIRSNNPDNALEPNVLRVVFDVELHLEKEPNTIDLEIYNLKQSTRAKLAEKNIRTTLEAGYFGHVSTIFDGKLDFGSTKREGVDWISTFQSTDGGDSYRKDRINEALAAGATLEQSLEKALSKSTLGIGNAVEQIKKGNLRGALDSFSGGVVMSGRVSDQISKIADLTGNGWSIQQGQIQFIPPDGVIDPNLALVLSPGTGLIGSPQPGDDGIVTAKSLLIPDLLPGRRVDIQAAEVSGFHRIERVRFSGDTRATDWYAEVEVKPL